jgi:hypothetical protein
VCCETLEGEVVGASLKDDLWARRPPPEKGGKGRGNAMGKKKCAGVEIRGNEGQNVGRSCDPQALKAVA